MVIVALFFTLPGCGATSELPPEIQGKIVFATTRTQEKREEGVIGIFTKDNIKYIKKESVSWPKWAPNRQELIYLPDFHRLVIVDENGRELQTIPSYQNHEIWDFDWFPDGGKLLVVDQPPNPNKDRRDQSLRIYDIVTGEWQPLIEGHGKSDRFRGIDVSPSGKEILYSRNHQSETSDQIYMVTLMDLETRKEKIFFDGKKPTWSPDGKSFAFIHSVHNKKGELVSMTEISVYDLETGKRRQITDRTGLWILELAFSPDGKSLIFSASTGEVNRLFHINVRGGKIIKLFEDGTTFADRPVSDSAPDWTA